jgi:hypothetical protein
MGFSAKRRSPTTYIPLLDRAILACYGWGDLDLGHGFHQNERGQVRYSVSDLARREMLARLLRLNLEVAEGEHIRGSGR